MSPSALDKALSQKEVYLWWNPKQQPCSVGGELASPSEANASSASARLGSGKHIVGCSPSCRGGGGRHLTGKNMSSRVGLLGFVS